MILIIILNLKDEDSDSSGVTKKYVDSKKLPDDVMRTSKVNIMGKDIDMGNNKLLNLKEIPSVSKAYFDSNKYKLPPSVMKTTKINIMGADLDMNNHKLLNLTGIPENIKTLIDSETKFIFLDKAKSASTLFPPFNGTEVDTSGIIARMASGSDRLFYSIILLPYIGYFSYYSDETESTLVAQNHWLKIHRPINLRSGVLSQEVTSKYCGVTYSSSQLFVELKP